MVFNELLKFQRFVAVIATVGNSVLPINFTWSLLLLLIVTTSWRCCPLTQCKTLLHAMEETVHLLVSKIWSCQRIFSRSRLFQTVQAALMDHSTVLRSATLTHATTTVVTIWTRMIFALTSVDNLVNHIDNLIFFQK